MRLLPILITLPLLLLALASAFAGEEPYRIADLETMREPKPALVRAAASLARGAMANRRLPVGEEAVYYAAGVGSIDEWYDLPSDLLETPPRARGYYRFVYRGGRLVSTHRNDDTGERVSSLYCYDERGFPILAVQKDAKGRTLLARVLTYDTQDRIKRVLVLDGENRALRMRCFVHHEPGYAQTESWLFDGMHAWASERRTLEHDGEVLGFKDGEWEKLPTYSRLAYGQALVAAGLEPPYPGALPAEPLPRKRVPRIRVGRTAVDAASPTDN